jgi:hypothetical protein
MTQNQSDGPRDETRDEYPQSSAQDQVPVYEIVDISEVVEETNKGLIHRTSVFHMTPSIILPDISAKVLVPDESYEHKGFCPIDVGALLEEEEEDIQWLLEGYLAPGAWTLLAGFPKVGKTTLAYDAVVAVALGKPFLGREVMKHKVLILCVEEHRRDVAARLRHISVEDLSGTIKVQSMPLPYDKQTLREILFYIQEQEIGFVLVDTLPAWWGVQDENDASSVLKAGKPLLNIIRCSGAAWLCLAHTRKGSGEHGEEVRGSSALTGMVDIGLSMKRVSGNENRRKLEAFSRYQDTPKELFVERSENGYVAVGTPDEVSIQANADKLWAVLTNDGEPRETLRAKTGLTSHGFDKAVKWLGNKVNRTGKGVKGSAHLYSRNSIRSDLTS